MFKLDCSDKIFNEDELDVLEKYGDYKEDILSKKKEVEIFVYNVILKYDQRIALEKSEDFSRCQREKDKIIFSFKVNKACGRGGCD